MTPKIKDIPKSRAKTAYGLLDEVKRLILEEPKRYNQELYLLKNLRAGDGFKVPTCGTMGCVAGWVSVLKTRSPGEPLSVGQFAAYVLGLTEEQRQELFTGTAIDQQLPRGAFAPAPQTRAYARLGVKHITAFQKKYAAQLKAQKV